MQILSSPISALNVRESPKFTSLTGNRGRGTRWWRQILDRKYKYGRFTHAQWKIRNITLIYGPIDEISASYRTWLWGRYHIPQNVFLVVNFICHDNLFNKIILYWLVQWNILISYLVSVLDGGWKLSLCAWGIRSSGGARIFRLPGHSQNTRI